LLTAFAQAQSNWVNYKLDAKLTVKFPQQPARVDEHSIYAKDADTSIYLVALIDYSKLEEHLDSAELAKDAPTTEFADEFKGGIVSQMPGSSLGEVTIDKWNGYTSYKIEGDYATKHKKLYVFVVLIGTKMYGLMAITPEKGSTNGKNYFFSSLTLN